MKIGKIENIRCGEASEETFVVVPDGLSQEEFQGAVSRARREYENVMAEEPLYVHDFPTSPPSIGELRKLPPETTVQQVLDAHDRRMEERKEREQQAERKRRSFGYYLEREGLPLVQRSTSDYTARADWGHRHGQKIRYDGLDVSYDSWWDEDEGNELCDEDPDAEEA